MVRSTATLGVCKILAKCWEVIPPSIITDFLKKLVVELASDCSSPDVRCSVFKVPRLPRNALTPKNIFILLMKRVPVGGACSFISHESNGLVQLNMAANELTFKFVANRSSKQLDTRHCTSLGLEQYTCQLSYSHSPRFSRHTHRRMEFLY